MKFGRFVKLVLKSLNEEGGRASASVVVEVRKLLHVAMLAGML